MGLSSSRMGRRPLRSRPTRTKRILSSLICGDSTSQSRSEMEYSNKSPVSSTENLAVVSDQSRSSGAESSAFGPETVFSASKTEVGTSSGSSADTFEENLIDNGLRNTETSDILERKESVSHQENATCNCNEVFSDKDSATASTFYTEQPFLESVSANSRFGSEGADNLAETTSHLLSVQENSSSVAQEHPHANSVDNHDTAVMGLNTSSSGSLSVLSDLLMSLHLFGDDNTEVVVPTRSEFPFSDSDPDLRTGSLLHVDVVSISSDILSSSIAEISNREARRNSRRLFWDALSRRSFRRRSDSPTIVFTTGHADDLGSHGRWLLDFSGDLHYDGAGREFEHLGTRRHHRNGRRWQLTSETSERTQSGLDEGGQQTTLCASGLHPDGTCSCDSFFMGEESSTLASISRIVMLAEALFEVLDEIHRQPLSLSLSTLSFPAPELVVNSFPLKNYKRPYAPKSEPSDVEQCHICLVEYEEGDKIRVLPCHHEYHMSCVDKWLKEIHGVCPLCRCNVSEGIPQGSALLPEVSSQ